MADSGSPRPDDFGTEKPSGTRWRSRLTHARLLLDDARAICRIQERVETARQTAAPSASVLEGEHWLHTARKVGFLPGSFNPLTVAHVALAEAARRTGELDVVVWGIAAATVDKETVERASLVDRLAQLMAYTRATSGNAVVVLNKGLYVDEATAMRACIAHGADLSIILGYDKIVQILDPHYYVDRDAALNRLFDAARILVGPREGFGRTELDALLAQPSNTRYRPYVAFVPLETAYATDSSTEVRQLAPEQPASDRIMDLVVPEGLALLDLHPYEAGKEGAAGRDMYMARMRWVRLLSQIPDQQRAGLPPLTRLAQGSLMIRSTGLWDLFWNSKETLSASEVWDLIRSVSGEASESGA